MLCLPRLAQTKYVDWPDDLGVIGTGEIADVWPLDLEHRGSEVGEVPGCDRSGDRLFECDDDDTVERGAHAPGSFAARRENPSRDCGSFMSRIRDATTVRRICAVPPPMVNIRTSRYILSSGLRREYPAAPNVCNASLDHLNRGLRR